MPRHSQTTEPKCLAAEYGGIKIYVQLVELGKVIGSFRTSERAWEKYYCEDFTQAVNDAKQIIDIMAERRKEKC